MIVFDLSLVGTGPAEPLRRRRRWGEVMARVPEPAVYDGVHELLAHLHARGQTLAILINSPSMVPGWFNRCLPATTAAAG